MKEGGISHLSDLGPVLIFRGKGTNCERDESLGERFVDEGKSKIDLMILERSRTESKDCPVGEDTHRFDSIRPWRDMINSFR